MQQYVGVLVGDVSRGRRFILQPGVVCAVAVTAVEVGPTVRRMERRGRSHVRRARIAYGSPRDRRKFTGVQGQLLVRRFRGRWEVWKLVKKNNDQVV